MIEPRWGGGMIRIGDVDRGRDNNFNLLRLIAASAVLGSHCWPLALGGETVEPLKALSGYTLGTTAVMVFFSISGFFITKSFVSQASVLDFMTARMCRIVPALFFVLFLSAFLMGSIFTSLPIFEYFSSLETYRYLLNNLILIRGQQWTLPGVFMDNPTPAVNGSLWTLYYEVLCYTLVVFAGLLGILRKSVAMFLPALAILTMIMVPQIHDSSFITKIDTLGWPFCLGAVAYIYRFQIYLNIIFVAFLLLMLFVTNNTVIYPILYGVFVAYFALWFGFIAAPNLRVYNKFGDYSYGVYIFAYPVQQMSVALFQPVEPLTLALLSFPPTLLLAILSWHLIEEPALNQRHQIGQLLGRWRMRVLTRRFSD